MGPLIIRYFGGGEIDGPTLKGRYKINNSDHDEQDAGNDRGKFRILFYNLQHIFIE